MSWHDKSSLGAGLRAHPFITQAATDPLSLLSSSDNLLLNNSDARGESVSGDGEGRAFSSVEVVNISGNGTYNRGFDLEDKQTA